MNELDEQQKRAIELDDALILAAPGSGKTRTLVAKAIKEDEEGKNVFVVTFTVSAAEEIKRRIEAEASNAIWVGTLHAMCLDIMRNAGLNLELADEAMMSELANSVKKSLRTQISDRRVSELLNGDESRWFGERLFVEAVQKQMQENSLVSYGGMLTVGLSCLKKQEFAPWRKGKDAIYLIDEAQDSGPVDLQIYEYLASTSAHLWMVGDLQQAIFSFRHPKKADVWEWWLQRAAAIGGTEICELPTNYRSSKAVVKACNAINEYFVPRVQGVARKNAPKGSVWVNVQKGEVSMFLEIANRVRMLMDCGSFNSGPNVIAILCRTNEEVANVGRFLESERISVCKRLQDAGPRVPERLWAALSVFIHPESDWRVKRWMLMDNERVHTEAVANKAAKEMKPLIGYFQPSLLSDTRRPLSWERWMDRMGIPKNEQSWFYQHVSEDWREKEWDEITLRLFEVAEVPEEGSGVTVITVHSAKGREWQHVLMPYCDDKSYQARNGPEEERIFFVAGSRAIETLVCYYAETRFDKWTNAQIEVNQCESLKKLLQARNPDETLPTEAQNAPQQRTKKRKK